MNEYYNIDCKKGMREFPDNYFDLAIVDLPRGDGTAQKFHLKSNQMHKSGLPIPKGNFPESKWDYIKTPPRYFKELFRVSKHQIIWTPEPYTRILPPSRCWIFWDKCNGDNHFGDFEMAWTSFDRPSRMLRYMWNGHMQGKSLKEGHIQQGNKKLNEVRIHATQKPEKLYLWLCNQFVKRNWKILDTHVGSASSLCAYEELGIKYVGYERDPVMYKLSSTRLDEKRKSLKDQLFTPTHKPVQLSII